jgi:hypothetical protein
MMPPLASKSVTENKDNKINNKIKIVKGCILKTLILHLAVETPVAKKRKIKLIPVESIQQPNRNHFLFSHDKIEKPQRQSMTK